MGTRPGVKPGDGDRPSTNPGIRPGNRPGTGPGNRPGTGPGNRPGSGINIGHRPGNHPGQLPNWHYGHGYWNRFRPGNPYHHWHNCHYRPWAWATWAGVGAWLGWSSSPVYYDYYDYTVSDGYIYDNGTQVASVEEYAEQATTIADAGNELGDSAEWMPVGVFAVVPTKNDEIQVTVQIAIAKDGTVGGTYFNSDGDITLPIQGSVDKQTQRVAWKVGEEDAVVMETGLDSLTKDQASIMLFFAGNVTETWTMIRLDEDAAKQARAGVAADDLRSQLTASYDRLAATISDDWRTFLALPPEVYSGGDPPSPDALQKSLKHYDVIAKDNSYRSIAERSDFQPTYQLLQQYAAELSK